MSAIVRHKHFKKMDSTCVFEKLIVEVRNTVPTCNHGPSPSVKKKQRHRSRAQKRELERTKKAKNHFLLRAAELRHSKRKANIQAEHALHILALKNKKLARKNKK